MFDRRRRIAFVWFIATAASFGVAGFVATDTIRTTVMLHSSLPWLDDWNTVDLFKGWTTGELPLLTATFSQFNEHRLLVPRIVFFADDLYLRGQGWLPLAAIVFVQVVHAALFATVLAGARTRGGGRWIVAALVLALMFSLKQAANFSSSFQLQFVGVFAAATAACVLFGGLVARAEAGRPTGPFVAGSVFAAATATFCMANGLVCGLVLILLAVAARLKAWIVAVFAVAWLVLAAVYLTDYDSSPADHLPIAKALLHPLALLAYAVSYLGNLAGTVNPIAPTVLGWLGIAATAFAAVLTMRRVVEPRTGLPLVGVMLFCIGSALVTATGRVDLGIRQALEQRYVTGGVAFWSAQVCFWWIAAPQAWPRTALLGLCAWLAVVLVGAQSEAKPGLVTQKAALDEATDLLLLGLDDPAVILRSAWGDDEVQRDAIFLRERGISIFGGPDGRSFGHPLADRGPTLPPDACAGGIGTATSDQSLGPEGVRVDGWGRESGRHRRLHRIFLVDQAGIVVGLARSAPTSGAPDAWRGFAVAPAGAALAAYGLVEGGGSCRLGDLRTVER